MYELILSTIAFICSVLCFFYMDKIIDKETNNTILKQIYESKILLGSIFFALSYYFSILYRKNKFTLSDPSPSPIIPQIPTYTTSESLNALPSYEPTPTPTSTSIPTSKS